MSELSLGDVVDRMLKRREQWLKEEGMKIRDYENSRLFHGGVKHVLKHFKNQHMSSDTEERLKPIWHESDLEATDAITALIHQGVDVKELNGVAALHYAAHNGHTNVVSLLLERGTDVDKCQYQGCSSHFDNGWTALHYAARDGSMDVISLLLECGADIAAKNENGKTALHYAAENGHTEVISWLLEQGADVGGKNYRDKTALHYAARNGNTDGISLLLERGADMDALDFVRLDSIRYMKLQL
ncbi:hypothetical protein PHMEG_00030162, partial [Phytophthora megakarya]